MNLGKAGEKERRGKNEIRVSQTGSTYYRNRKESKESGALLSVANNSPIIVKEEDV